VVLVGRVVARTALSAAGVIGRDFELDLLLAVLELPEARLLDLLEEAVAASLLKESRDRAGLFTFTHALVEHARYEDLGTSRCARLHRQVAQALEEQCGDEPGERLGELAGHWVAAVVSTDIAKAVMTGHPNLKGYFGCNEGSMKGVMNAAKELGREGKIVMIGYDAGQQLMDEIRSGVVAGAITQDPIGIGYKSVQALVDALAGKTLPKFIDTGFHWYDKTNIDDPTIAALLYK